MRAPAFALVGSIGLVALVLAAGCLGATDAPEAPRGERRETSEAGVEAATFAFDGRLTATPATPASQDFAFDVPKGAVEVAATLTWETPELNDLRIELLDPRGEPVGGGFPEKPGQASVATLDPPASGAWTARVYSTRALDAPFALAVSVGFLVPGDNVLADAVDLGPGDFAELNLIMEGGASFNFSFEATGGTVSWNVHSHEDGKTTIHERGAGVSSHSDRFEAPKRQIYSILFQADATPVALEYAVIGSFRVHSHSQ